MMAAARLIVKLRAPHYIMENVVSVMTSPEWQATQTFLRQNGFEDRNMTVNANDCGVPQRRFRTFVVESRTAGGSALDAVAETALEWSTAGPDTPARDAEFGGKRRPTIKEAVTGIGNSYWCRARNMTDACVCASDEPARTVLTTRTGKPR